MTHLLAGLPDDYLRDMAAYFSEQHVPYPAPVRADVSAATLEAGRKLAKEGDAARGLPACASCHGAALSGMLPAIPGLLGLPRLYVSSQLGAWLTKERHAPAPDCMAQIGQRMTTADINAVASWLAVQPMPADTRPAASLPAPLPVTCGGMPTAAKP